ncbi:hypothetical protein AJ79_00869 [Helicocarpus griseus UAMH5409]|uniref:Epoxide hydrolase N-terminal domain-containing protein n=1 Tax=Helicocarpus griseus UAMH5409 TaxID=1447875 RepID=A0A2B7Y9Y1_9EURO|nr:hypothetical protein AJ79_00869 [Helicocarpus griseus UAMH5409]
MAAPYTTIPRTALKVPEPYHIGIPEQQLSDFKTLLKLSKIPAATYENLQEDGRFGVSRRWLEEMKGYWEEGFEWRKTEEHINSFPNFMSTVTIPVENGENEEYKIHFVALFSEKQDAAPLVLLHGWPGSFLEFLPLLSLMRSKYTPQTLPYHLIIPSLPGYAFSSPPPLTRDFAMNDICKLVNQLMLDLGFGQTGYLAQGGDVGSFVARRLSAEYEACKAIHLNFFTAPTFPNPPEPAAQKPLSEKEKVGIQRGQLFQTAGSAYAMEHATRPSTIGLVLGSSPLALLAWIGEKFVHWSDEVPAKEEILRSVTLYWFTETLGRGIYPYRDIISGCTNGAGVLGEAVGVFVFPQGAASDAEELGGGVGKFGVL